ncbi:hypothetical protein AMAG_08415 [Allomyces macrogynus ATCC 38327]|uniref:Uncharacterized protein n=1 Tax=Allomyces macrogynus (strain ATCC 38327) TaxID=578462 RepID=A0A0L0SLF5_ALLM3|nr:hypothetical protein AMAG_08415 [Allomyces macrogynus ATCC 38327]|eukprot:KNE63273.1 hypothetical protein AMAG_08415 [Allomyces macrogynus ATCC 38327]
MPTFQYQYRAPRDGATRTIPDVALHAFTLAELKELIENDPAVRAYIAQVLADFTQGHGRHREESYEAANAEEDKDNVDATPAVPFRTKNGKGKAVATATTGVEDASGSSSSSSTTTATHHGSDARAAASSASADAAKARAQPSASAVRSNVFQQRAASRPAVIPQASSSRMAGRASTVPSGLVKPNAMWTKAECQDILQYIGPAAVHTDGNDGAHLPWHIPQEIASFIDDVRTCVDSWPSYTKKSLYCVEYHGGTWFVAAGFMAYLHRTKHGWNHDGYVVVRKEIQGQLLAAMKAGKLHGIRVWDDKLAPGNDAGKGGNNGGPGTWFVRPDVYWARFAHALSAV